MNLFISCIPGLEEVLGQEVSALGYTYTAARAGCFVPFKDMRQIYRLNLHLRTASRVLLPLTSFTCRDKNDLYIGASEVDWLPYFKKLPTFAIDSVVMHKLLTNSLFAAQVVKDAICDQLKKHQGVRPNVDTSSPQIGLHLYIFNNQATISFDTSNPALHCRGYRLEGGEAPLRENLAAGLLLLAGYKRTDVLLDPCCGSGTFLIEAAMIASNTAPHLSRTDFGFMRHPEYDPDLWDEVVKEAKSAVIPLEKGMITGIESSLKTFQVLKRSISRSKFDRWLGAVNGDFRELSLPVEPNFVITNPPYGVRLSEIKELESLYSDLGDFMKCKTKKPARGAIFTGSLELAKYIGLKSSKRHVLENGGIECRLLEYDLY